MPLFDDQFSTPLIGQIRDGTLFVVNNKIFMPNCYYIPFNDKIATKNLNVILINTLWLWAFGGEVHCGSNLVRKKEDIFLEIKNK